jgi:hypothetical protein
LKGGHLKANVREEQIAQLASAGFTMIQCGTG